MDPIVVCHYFTLTMIFYKIVDKIGGFWFINSNHHIKGLSRQSKLFLNLYVVFHLSCHIRSFVVIRNLLMDKESHWILTRYVNCARRDCQVHKWVGPKEGDDIKKLPQSKKSCVLKSARSARLLMLSRWATLAHPFEYIPKWIYV